MDLIYTNADRADMGVLTAYAFDLSFGCDENDFEIELGASEPALDYGAMIYMDGTEYGGIVDEKEVSTDGETIIYRGRTWHGMLNSKVIQPDTGADYLIVSGNANEILAMLLERLGLSELFVARETPAEVTVKRYQFKRYCLGYDGIREMLAANNAKLKIVWEGRAVHLYAEPVVDYTTAPIDGDVAALKVRRAENKVNHLICLGRGELAEREVVHLYADSFGQIIATPYYTGLAEYAQVFDYSSAESSEDLRTNGIEHLQELRAVDSAEISVPENETLVFDIGDIVGSTEMNTGTSVAAAVTQKIVRIDNGAISTDYKTGS